MKDRVAYRRILDILKDVERVDSKLMLWELLIEAYNLSGENRRDDASSS